MLLDERLPDVRIQFLEWYIQLNEQVLDREIQKKKRTLDPGGLLKSTHKTITTTKANNQLTKVSANSISCDLSRRESSLLYVLTGVRLLFSPDSLIRLVFGVYGSKPSGRSLGFISSIFLCFFDVMCSVSLDFLSADICLRQIVQTSLSSCSSIPSSAKNGIHFSYKAI